MIFSTFHLEEPNKIPQVMQTPECVAPKWPEDMQSPGKPNLIPTQRRHGTAQQSAQRNEYLQSKQWHDMVE